MRLIHIQNKGSFLGYRNGKCIIWPTCRYQHKIATILVYQILNYSYTSHAFRRSYYVTLAACALYGFTNSGKTWRWKSNFVAENYVDESIENKTAMKIFGQNTSKTMADINLKYFFAKPFCI